MPANGGQPQRLTNDPTNDSQPSWSQDGNSIYFASPRTGREEVWRVPASGGAAVQVTRDGGYTAFESEDGKLYYNKSDNETKLWRCNLDGSGGSASAGSRFVSRIRGHEGPDLLHAARTRRGKSPSRPVSRHGKEVQSP